MDLAPARDLLGFVDASPTPYHAVAEVVRRLEPAGYVRLDERERWRLGLGDKVYVVRGGSSVLAFELGSEPPDRAGFRLIGAHTDSPNFRLKPRPETVRSGFAQLGVEPYGGVLFHTWLDRDLSIAGRLLARTDGLRPRELLVRLRAPLLRIPNLAIHLQRGVNTDGVVLNAQQHLAPVAGLDALGSFTVRELCAQAAREGGVTLDPHDVLGFDLSVYDTQPSALAGAHEELVFAPRLDNLASCHAAISALLSAPGPSRATRGIVLYDHEECGSRSAQGADSPFLRMTLERLCAALPDHQSDTFARAVAHSLVISADMAHGVHPNYPDKHEPMHAPQLGQGPVLKSNVNQSYATDGEGWAIFERLCGDASVTPQVFVTRSDLPCGSTIGSITAGQLGIRTFDIGNPMLSMHSARELAAATDVPKMIAVMRRFFVD